MPAHRGCTLGTVLLHFTVGMLDGHADQLDLRVDLSRLRSHI